MVSFVGATSASAAEPSTLAVTPASAATQTVATGGSASYTISYNNDISGGSIYYAVASGPDGASAPFTAGKLCVTDPAPAKSATCTVTNGGTAGQDKLVFFFHQSTTPTAQFLASDPSVTGAVLNITGPINSIAADSTGHTAQGQWVKYTFTAKDSNGTAIPGQALNLTATQANQLPVGTLQVVTTAPAVTAFTGTDPAGTTSQTVNQPLATGTDGTVSVWINSTVAGPISLTIDPTPVKAGVQTKTTLTVDPGTNDDVTKVVTTPAEQTSFEGAPVVSEVVTVSNEQGDLVGDPAAKPVAALISGPNAGQPVTVTAAPDAQAGTYYVTYAAQSPDPAKTTTGTDKLQAFVNKTTGTGGLDDGEISATATINITPRPTGIHITRISSDPVNASTNSDNALVIFQVTNGAGDPLAGYNVQLAVQNDSTPAGRLGNFSVSPALATTGADGRFTATVTDTAPKTGDNVHILATVVGDSSLTADANVTFNAPSDVVVIQPYANTTKVNGTATFSATTTDPTGTAVSGVNYVWQVITSTNDVINGVGASFNYTDAGSPNADRVDQVAVSAYQGADLLGTDTVPQYWVRDGAAKQANISIDNFGGSYVGQGINGQAPYTPQNFVSTETEGIIGDPTSTNPVVGTVPVGVMLADSNNNRLFGKSVTFTTSGVGQFVDATGHNLGTSLTVRVDDDAVVGSTTENGAFDLQPQTSPHFYGWASVYVRSADPGTQTITASVDGVSTVGTVEWAGQFVPVTPSRVFDTRTGQGGVGNKPVNPGTVTFFDYDDTSLPLDASAYVFNVTAIGATQAGNLRIADACNGSSVTRDSSVPDTSLVNYQPGKDVANTIVVSSDCGFGDGALKVYSAGSAVNVAIDVQGYYLSGFEQTAPTRLADTRTGVGTSGVSELNAGQTMSVQVTGVAGIPADAKAVALNVTAIHPSGAGNLRVFPNGADVPNASNINYQPGVDKAGFVVVNVPANGKIDFYSAGSNVGVAVDVFGYYPKSSNVVTSAPVRVFDSRDSSPIAANGTATFKVTGQAGVPDNAQAVLVNLTAIHTNGSTGSGNLRIYPTGATTMPLVSNINYVSKGSDVANFAIVKVGTGGQLTLFSAGSPIDAAVDVLGYVPAGS